jgi:ectoine hydroxylase-related dioxygenase (phytanoyl-CoA dioxygenase family)
MAYVPGSHRSGIRKFIDIFGVFGPEPEDLLADPAITGVEPVFVEVPRGTVAFHHGLTAHLAGANATGHDRRVHTVIYFADGCTRRVGGFGHFAVDRPGIEPGAVIASDLTPSPGPAPDPASHPHPPAEPEAQGTSFARSRTACW